MVMAMAMVIANVEDKDNNKHKKIRKMAVA